jgi:hypothetical protein
VKIQFYVSKPDDPPRSATSEWNGLPIPPATRSNILSPKAGQDLLPLSRAAIKFLQDLNPGRAATMSKQYSNMIVLAIPWTGQFNQSSRTWWKDGTTPKFETLGYAWNTYAGYPEDKTYPGYVRLITLNHSSTVMPDAKLHNWYTEPWLYHIMTAISPKGRQFRIGKSWSLFVPIFSRSEDKPLYHKLSDLESYPTIPMEVTISPSNGISVYTSPSMSSPVLYSLRKGEMVIIHGYIPKGNDVWASIIDKYSRRIGRWICLRQQINGVMCHFTNEWRLKTEAVLPPVPVYPIDKVALPYQVYGHGLE